jgi:hypothetical protein
MDQRTALHFNDKDFDVEFTPEWLTPHQYFDCTRAWADLQAEKRLMLAVLKDAFGRIERSLNSPRRRSRSSDEVESWLATEACDSPFSFVAICQALDLDPSYVRTRLHRWRQQRANRRQRADRA